MAAKDSDGLPAFGCSGRQAESTSVVPAAAVFEIGLCGCFNLAGVLEQHSVGAVLVIADAAFDRSYVQYAGMACKEGVDPPTVYKVNFV